MVIFFSFYFQFETKHIEATLDYIQKMLLGTEADMRKMDVKVMLRRRKEIVSEGCNAGHWWWSLQIFPAD